MKTPDAAFLSALIPTLLILIHVATAATDNSSQSTPLMTPAKSTSIETTTKAVESSTAESSRNPITEASPLQANDSSTTPSADNVTLSTSASSSLMPVKPTTPGSTAFPVTQAKTSKTSSSSVSPATHAGSAGALDGVSIAIVLLAVIVLLILILLAVFKWASHPSNQNRPTSRLILGFGERVRGEVRTLEDRLGFRLWPGGRGAREGDEEEVEEGKMSEVVVGVEGEGGEQKDEEEEDGEDSSDDYSSTEGDDLRQRAPSGEKEEEEEQREEKRKSEEGQGEEKGGRDGGGEEAIALIGPEWEQGEGEIEESDVTIL